MGLGQDAGRLLTVAIKSGTVKAVNYDEAPLLTIWEVTRSCELACRHCRASAENLRSPLELTLDEGKALIDEVAAMGTPLLVFTGGDPLQRPDLEDLIRHGRERGLIVATIPAATPRLTRERIFSLKDAGVHQLALSLDGATAKEHDEFRGVEGTFRKVEEAVSWIHEAGVPLQINTVFGSWNADRFDALAEKIRGWGTSFWEIFFLVPTGRGAELTSCTASQFEQLFEQIHRFARETGITVKVTEAQHFRRFQQEHGGAAAGHGRVSLSSRPVNAGNGFCFIDFQGKVMPSGFLPLDCGNIRKTPLADIYQKHPDFRQLRNLSALTGPCATCSFLETCSGGSRARAWALTGDYTSSEPFCVKSAPSSGRSTGDATASRLAF